MSDAAELFQAIIEEHRRRPRNRGPLPTANRVATRENPACGDRCTLHLELDPAGRIRAAAFTGSGCALSQASASLATTALTGRGSAEVPQLASALEALLQGRPAPAAEPSLPGDLAALAAVRAYPARHACALLAWQCALAALQAGPASPTAPAPG